LRTLLTTQRIISNGLAQLRFEAIWPDLSRAAFALRGIERHQLPRNAPLVVSTDRLKPPTGA
jgi:hypothetical protein